MTAEHQTSLYVAFSIHGTNAFITASRRIPTTELPKTLQDLEAEGFTRVWSRNPRSIGVKLHWNKLQNKKTGQPYVSPAHILRRFNELRDLGWGVTTQKFTFKHWKKNHANHQAVAG